MRTYSFTEYAGLCIKSLRAKDALLVLLLAFIALLLIDAIAWVSEALIVLAVLFTAYKFLADAVIGCIEGLRVNKGGIFG